MHDNEGLRSKYMLNDVITASAQDAITFHKKNPKRCKKSSLKIQLSLITESIVNSCDFMYENCPIQNVPNDFRWCI